MIEDDPVRPKPDLVAAPALDRLGVDELRDYVARLHAEVARAEAEIGRKQAVRDAAHGFFKTP